MDVIKKAGAPKAVKCPTKRTVNLAKRESHRQSIITLVCGVAIIAILCVLVAKFAVIDQFNRLNEAEAAYDEVHNQLLDMESDLERYPEVEQEYRTYSRGWMTGDSSIAVTVDRSDVLYLMEQRLMSCGTVKTFVVSGSTVLVNMSDMNLEEISQMFAKLQQEHIVSSAALTIASTAEDADADLDFSITIILQPEEEAEK